jgi:hypothetical protein
VKLEHRYPPAKPSSKANVIVERAPELQQLCRPGTTAAVRVVEFASRSRKSVPSGTVCATPFVMW